MNATLTVTLHPTMDVTRLNAMLAQVREAFGPLGKSIVPIDEKKWSAAFGTVEEEADAAKKAIKDAADESEKSAKRGGDAWMRAFKLNAVRDGINDVLAGIRELASPSVALDTATAQLRTLGDEAAAMAPSLRASAIQMSRDLPFAAADLQSTMFDALASGVQGGEEGLKRFAKTAAQLSVGGSASIGDATKLIAGQLNAYGESADQAGRYADIFFNTVNFGVVSVSELSSTMSNVIPTASSLGIEIENIGASFAVMTSKGVPAAQTSTKVNQLLLEMAKPGAALAPILERAGVSLESLRNEDLPTNLRRVSEALKETGKASVQVFSSSEAAAAFNVLTSDLDGLDAALVNVRDTTGSTQNAYDQMASSIDVRTKQMMSAVQSFIIEGLDSLGTGVLTVAQSAGQLAPLVSTATGLAQIVPKGFTDSVQSAGKAILGRLVPGLMAQVGATGAATTAQFSLNAAIMANPIGATIAGIVALAAATKFLSDALHETATERLEEQKGQTAVLEEQRAVTQSRYDAIRAQTTQAAAYKGQVDAVRELQAASAADGLTIDARAAKQRIAADATDALRERTIGLAATFPGAVSAGKSFEDNLSSMQATALSSADELIRVAGELNALDVSLAKARSLEMNLEVQVAAEELESQLTDALDTGFMEGLAAIGKGDIAAGLDSVFLAGFGTEISEALFGTSTTRKTSEQFVEGFKKDVFNAKTADELAAAQSKMISTIAVKGDEMGINPKEQAALIKSVRSFGEKRKAELDAIKKNDADLSATSAANIQKAFSDATAAGKDVTSTVSAISKAFQLSGDKVKDVAIDGELQKAAKQGKLTDETIAKLSSTFGVAGDRVKNAAFAAEMKATADAGSITDKQVEDIAKKYGKSVDEARTLLAEQKKQTTEAKATADAAASIGDAFNEAKKAASEAFSSQQADLAGLNRKIREATTEQERDQARADRTALIAQGKRSKAQLDAFARDEELAKRQLGLNTKTVKDHSDDVIKIERETAAIRSELERKALTDETERNRQALKQKLADDERSVQDEINATRKNKELSARDRARIEAALTEQLKAVKERGAAELVAFEGSVELKRREDAAKLAEAGIAGDIELARRKVDALAVEELRSGETSIDRARAIADERLAIARAESKQQLDELVAKNRGVAAAQESLNKAIASGNQDIILDAEAELFAKRAAAIASDPLVVQAYADQGRRVADVQAQNDEDVERARIGSLSTLAERTRELAILEARKTYDEQKKAARGNDAVELDAHRSFLKAKAAAEEQYRIDTDALYAAGVAIRTNLLKALSSGNAAAEAERRSQEKASHQQRIKELEAEQKRVNDAFALGSSTFEDYQQGLFDLSQQRADQEEEFRRKQLEAEQKFRADLLKQAIDGIRAAADEQIAQAQRVAEQGGIAYEQFAVAGALSFGALTASGDAASVAALRTVLDTATKALAIYSAQIMALFMATIPPPFGAIAGVGAIGTAATLMAVARANIGARHGGKIDENYRGAVHPQDTILLRVQKGERVFSVENVERNEPLFRFIQDTGGDYKDYYDKTFGKNAAPHQSVDTRPVVEAVRGVAERIDQFRRTYSRMKRLPRPVTKPRTTTSSAGRTNEHTEALRRGTK